MRKFHGWHGDAATIKLEARKGELEQVGPHLTAMLSVMLGVVVGGLMVALVMSQWVEEARRTADRNYVDAMVCEAANIKVP